MGPVQKSWLAFHTAAQLTTYATSMSSAVWHSPTGHTREAKYGGMGGRGLHSAPRGTCLYDAVINNDFAVAATSSGRGTSRVIHTTSCHTNHNSQILYTEVYRQLGSGEFRGDAGGGAPIDLTNFCINVKVILECTKTHLFQIKKFFFFWGGGTAPSPDPSPWPSAPHYKILDPPLLLGTYYMRVVLGVHIWKCKKFQANMKYENVSLQWCIISNKLTRPAIANRETPIINTGYTNA